ncbi:hypothetical protein F2Q69_00019323 [Brassica cretica]|uniref:RNA-dependent RNA polymerase n=1 Tax=Brassica cretica TaxID=69181 RepID=A0A8S9Q8R1_BRACR|nr:hypothetical protein F2Q69_00019323 [Brassica cretica]
MADDVDLIPYVKVFSYRHTMCVSDGIGKISSEFAELVARECNNKGVSPSAFQIGKLRRNFSNSIGKDIACPRREDLHIRNQLNIISCAEFSVRACPPSSISTTAANCFSSHLEEQFSSRRLGPSNSQDVAETSKVVPGKKKLSRPPGKHSQQSPKGLQGTSSRKRKIQQTKPPVARRKLNISEGNGARNSRARPANSRDTGSPANLDNQPICNMIPARSKRRMDFQNPSLPGP